MKLKMVVVDLEIPSHVKHRLLQIGIPALVLGTGALAYASVPKTWMDGQPLTAADLNGNFSALDQRLSAVEASAPPPGTIVAFGGSTCPSGTVPADGSSLVTTGTYSRLYAAIGSNWGSADSNHFNAPNLLNRFVRGAGSPTDGNGGTAVKVGQYQEAATRVYSPLTTGGQSADHSHSVPYITGPNGEFGGVNGGPNPGGFHTYGDQTHVASGGSSNDHAHTVPTGQGDGETRPKSYGVLFCVFY